MALPRLRLFLLGPASGGRRRRGGLHAPGPRRRRPRGPPRRQRLARPAPSGLRAGRLRAGQLPGAPRRLVRRPRRRGRALGGGLGQRSQPRGAVRLGTAAELAAALPRDGRPGPPVPLARPLPRVPGRARRRRAGGRDWGPRPDGRHRGGVGACAELAHPSVARLRGRPDSVPQARGAVTRAWGKNAQQKKKQHGTTYHKIWEKVATCARLKQTMAKCKESVARL